MSHGNQRKEGFTPGGSVEHERRLAVRAVLREGGEILAEAEEGSAGFGSWRLMNPLEKALARLAEAFGEELP